MEWLIIIITALLAITVLVNVYLLLYTLVFDPILDFLFYHWYRFFPRQVVPHYQNILLRDFPYYKNLDVRHKQRFEHRLMVFLDTKKFIGEEGLQLTDEVRVLIAASAIQLTLGLRHYRLRSFHRIIVLPGSYYYKQHESKFRGHVSSFGKIYLSWDHFRNGYLDPSDGINLGLHEMTHALIEELLSYEVDFQFYDDYQVWKKLGEIELKRIRKKENRFLRSYAGTNLDELLAVSVEYFFEVPQQFREHLPELYERMVELFGQDPGQPKSPVLALRS